MPSQREILVKEQILAHKFRTNNLNIVKCNVCRECQIQNNVLPDQESYTCKKCCKRKDDDYNLNNNLHPVRFKVNEDGSHKLDEAGKKSTLWDTTRVEDTYSCQTAPHSKMRNFCTLCSSSNGTFALKGHCVTFPQYITQMCDELPHRKEQVLVFIRYIGNKDTSAVYPKSMRVNQQNIINALLWLKKYNPHYSNVTINESNLDWMTDKDEANIGQEGTILSTKNTQCYTVL